MSQHDDMCFKSNTNCCWKIHNSLTHFLIFSFSWGIYGFLLGHFSLLWEFSPKKRILLLLNLEEKNTKMKASFNETQYVNGTCFVLNYSIALYFDCVSVSVSITFTQADSSNHMYFQLFINFGSRHCRYSVKEGMWRRGGEGGGGGGGVRQ